MHCAGLRLVLFICMTRVPVAGCQVSLHFRASQGKRQGSLEQKGRGGKFGKLLCHQVGLEMSFGFGLHWQQRVLPGAWLRSPQARAAPRHDHPSWWAVSPRHALALLFGTFSKNSCPEQFSLPWTSVDSDCHVQRDVAALLCVNTCGDRCMPSG